MVVATGAQLVDQLVGPFRRGPAYARAGSCFIKDLVEPVRLRGRGTAATGSQTVGADNDGDGTAVPGDRHLFAVAHVLQQVE